jgi:hypothetical protein
MPLDAKLDLYDVTSFMNCHSTNLFLGKPKSGKTSLLYSFFKSPQLFRKLFTKIFLFQPTSSRVNMSDQLFNVLPDDQLFDELNEENLTFVMQEIESEESPRGNNCIIFDDMTSYLKEPENLKILKKLIFNRRHIHTSIFFLVQTYKSVPKEIRKLFNNMFIFKVSKNELNDIFDEVIEHSKNDLLEISKIVFDKPHEYLFINTDTQRLFKGFDEILITENKKK